MSRLTNRDRGALWAARRIVGLFQQAPSVLRGAFSNRTVAHNSPVAQGHALRKTNAAQVAARGFIRAARVSKRFSAANPTLYLVLYLALLVLLCPAPPLFAANWIRVTSPHIEIVTDAGEKTGRELVSYFETIRAVFNQAGIGDSPLPVRAFAFASESEFRAFNDEKNSAGFYHGGERDYIALYAGADARRVALHEYVHSVLHHSKLSLPKWFEEGTAEFYSNLEISPRTANPGVVRDRTIAASSGDSRAAERKLEVGYPIASHLAVLRNQPWLSADLLGSAKPDGVIYYSECWALVHMLNLAPDWREGMPRFILSLADARPADQAFRESFGKTLDDALSHLPAYLPSIRPVSLAIDIQQSSEGPRVDRIAPIEAALERADLALQLHRIALARSLITAAVRGQPETAQTTAALGTLAMAEGHNDEARKQFERAIALGSHDAETWFQYAMLERDSGSPLSRVDELLARVVSMDPNFAEAQFLLGEHQSDDGNYSAAVEHLREAVRVRPRESNYWYALAFAQMKLGNPGDAIDSARRAKRNAPSDPDEQMADALIALISEPAPAPAPAKVGKGPDVIIPPSWQNPVGDARVEGTLTGVVCEGEGARLVVTDAAGKTIALMVRHPDRVRLVNAPGVEHVFSCGAQSLPVAIEFVRSTFEVTRIEFR